MSEYDNQARDFLERHNIKLRIVKAELQTPPLWAEANTVSGYKYDVTMATSRGAYTFPFWDSVHNRQHHKRPTAYDVLACLDMFEGTIDDFVDTFGYSDAKTSHTIAVYNEVIDQSLQLKHILPAKALQQLQEIN